MFFSEGSIANMTCTIYFYASLLGIAFKSFIDDKDFTAQSVCKNNGLFVCLYKLLSSTCFVLLYHFLLMCNAFVSIWRSKIFFKKKNCWFWFNITYSFLCLYTYCALSSKTPVIIRPCHIQDSRFISHLIS